MRTGPKMAQIRLLLGQVEHMHSLVLENGEKKDRRHNLGVVLSTYLLANLLNFFLTGEGLFLLSHCGVGRKFACALLGLVAYST